MRKINLGLFTHFWQELKPSMSDGFLCLTVTLVGAVYYFNSG